MERDYVWQDRKRIWCGLPWTFTTYALSEDRLFITSGLLKMVADEVRLYRIMDISLTKTLIQRIFGLGTVVVRSADQSLGNFSLKNIQNAEEVKEMLSELVEKNRESKRVLNREFMGDSMSEESI